MFPMWPLGKTNWPKSNILLINTFVLFYYGYMESTETIAIHFTSFKYQFCSLWLLTTFRFLSVTTFIIMSLFYFIIVILHINWHPDALRKQPPDLKLVSALMGKHTVSLIADPGLWPPEISCNDIFTKQQRNNKHNKLWLQRLNLEM